MQSLWQTYIICSSLLLFDITFAEVHITLWASSSCFVLHAPPPPVSLPEHLCISPNELHLVHKERHGEGKQDLEIYNCRNIIFLPHSQRSMVYMRLPITVSVRNVYKVWVMPWQLQYTFLAEAEIKQISISNTSAYEFDPVQLNSTFSHEPESLLEMSCVMNAQHGTAAESFLLLISWTSSVCSMC